MLEAIPVNTLLTNKKTNEWPSLYWEYPVPWLAELEIKYRYGGSKNNSNFIKFKCASSKYFGYEYSYHVKGIMGEFQLGGPSYISARYKFLRYTIKGANITSQKGQLKLC